MRVVSPVDIGSNRLTLGQETLWSTRCYVLVSVPKMLGLQIVGFVSHVERVLHSHHLKHVLGNCLCIRVCVISNHMTNNISSPHMWDVWPHIWGSSHIHIYIYVYYILKIYMVMHTQVMILVCVGISTHSIVWLCVWECELLLFECSRGQVICYKRYDQREIERATEKEWQSHSLWVRRLLECLKWPSCFNFPLDPILGFWCDIA